MPAFAIVMRHHGCSASAFFRTWTAKVGTIIPGSSSRANDFCRTVPHYGKDDQRSDSYMELQHGIKVQHEFTVTEDRDSIGGLPHIPDYFGDNANKAEAGKKAGH